MVLIGASQVVKYIVPERRLRESGVPRRSMLVGVLLGIVGFFVIPVVGMFVGFPLGVYLSERQRLGAHAHAWTSTKHALRATGLSILIELDRHLTRRSRLADRRTVPGLIARLFSAAPEACLRSAGQRGKTSAR